MLKEQVHKPINLEYLCEDEMWFRIILNRKPDGITTTIHVAAVYMFIMGLKGHLVILLINIESVYIL